VQQHSEKMTGKIILIAGGTSPDGLGIVRYFLEQDATLVVPAKSLTEINRLKGNITDIESGTLITQLTELPDYDSGFDIAETIVERFGKIDIGIAIFNGMPCKKELTELHISDWQNMMDNEVTPFFVCARLILRTMKENSEGLYISVCDSSLLKQENSCPLSKIAANAKMEMSKIFADEIKKHNVKYYHLWVDQNVERQPTTDCGEYTSVVSSEMIGSRIQQLYFCKATRPDDIFQLF
jgi:NADP-dependent 3-hydroxy acid dehydrogenase YdfG